jgi:hypothetical protein
MSIFDYFLGKGKEAAASAKSAYDDAAKKALCGEAGHDWAATECLHDMLHCVRCAKCGETDRKYGRCPKCAKVERFAEATGAELMDRASALLSRGMMPK